MEDQLLICQVRSQSLYLLSYLGSGSAVQSSIVKNNIILQSREEYKNTRKV
jgi:hypothetical protein